MSKIKYIKKMEGKKYITYFYCFLALTTVTAVIQWFFLHCNFSYFLCIINVSNITIIMLAFLHWITWNQNIFTYTTNSINSYNYMKKGLKVTQYICTIYYHDTSTTLANRIYLRWFFWYDTTCISITFSPSTHFL